jgi:AcrR family transcriptional regulator
MQRKWDPILKAAKEAFLAKGFESVSMDEVASQAGTTKRTIYNNFGSKDRLLQAVFAQAERDFRDAAPTLDQYGDEAALTVFAGAAVVAMTNGYAIAFQRMIAAGANGLRPHGKRLINSARSRLETPLAAWLAMSRGLADAEAQAAASAALRDLTASARLDRLMLVREPYDVNGPIELDDADRAAVAGFVDKLTRAGPGHQSSSSPGLMAGDDAPSPAA